MRINSHFVLAHPHASYVGAERRRAGKQHRNQQRDVREAPKQCSKWPTHKPADDSSCHRQRGRQPMNWSAEVSL
jgi:hypothetical protein